MSALTWDDVGGRLFETGVDKGVLYIPDGSGVYSNGVAWSGLTKITETPAGAAATPQWADNVKFLNLISTETFDATVNAFTYPEEFAQFDGSYTPTPGVRIGQQSRKSFGLSYRSRIGSDLDGDSHGYKIHLVYGCQAAPSPKDFSTVNDVPAIVALSWVLSTTPAAVTGSKPTSLITIDSTKVNPATLTAFETILYGASGVNPMLPNPDAVVAAFSAGITTVATLTVPTFNATTGVITIPTQTGITYYIAGVAQAAGAGTAIGVSGTHVIVNARANTGYAIAAGNDTDWEFTRV